MTAVTSVGEAIEARSEEVGISSSRLARLSRVMEGHVEAGRMPGAIAVVVRHGRVVHFDLTGSMDIEAGKPMRRDTIFRIASMTKPIVSLALMQLYEEGLFQLDHPAAKYIPEFEDLKVFTSGDAERYTVRPPARAMTIRDLLCHTSGLSSPALGPRAATMSDVAKLYTKAGIAGIGHEGTLRDTIVKLGNLPLEADPGTRWIYGISTDVVAYLCEVLSGRPLDQLLREKIFAPLGMDDTFFYVPPAKHERLASSYRLAEGGYDLLDPASTSVFAGEGTYFSGVGGLCSTADDYTRFVKMLLGRGELDGARVIGTRTLEYMAQNHLPGRQAIGSLSTWQYWPGTGFGLGFAVLEDPAASGCVGSRGEYHWSGAFSTHFFVSPADDLAAVFMTQLFPGGPPVAIGRDLRVAVYQALLD
jgi:CubicO group peptidase (beta-lactamase class C family)